MILNLKFVFSKKLCWWNVLGCWWKINKKRRELSSPSFSPAELLSCCGFGKDLWEKHHPPTVALFNHPSAPLRRCFISLLSYSAMRLRECIECFMRRTAILKNNSTAEKRRQEGAFALASIAHYCFVETKTNCAPKGASSYYCRKDRRSLGTFHS